MRIALSWHARVYATIRYLSAELDARAPCDYPTSVVQTFDTSGEESWSGVGLTGGGLELLVHLSFGVAIAQKGRADSPHHNGPLQ